MCLGLSSRIGSFLYPLTMHKMNRHDGNVSLAKLASGMTRVAKLLGEVVGLALIALGVAAANGFLAADTPLEALHRGIAALPCKCEAGYLNHGSYMCWYTGTHCARIPCCFFSRSLWPSVAWEW